MKGMRICSSAFHILDRNEQEAAAARPGRPRDAGELGIRVRLRREFLFLIFPSYLIVNYAIL
jgi:hypothetical protein